MSTSYVHEFAKIGSVDDVYRIYDTALSNKDAELEKAAGVKRLQRIVTAIEKAHDAGKLPAPLYRAQIRAESKIDRRLWRAVAPSAEKVGGAHQLAHIAPFQKEAISATAVGGAIQSRMARLAGTAYREAPSVMTGVSSKLKGAEETAAQVRQIGANAAERSKRIGGQVGERYQTISNVADAHLGRARTLGQSGSHTGAHRLSAQLNPTHELGHLAATAHPVQQPGLLARMGVKKPGMFSQYAPDVSQMQSVSKLKRL